jgi:hypothetical protein
VNRTWTLRRATRNTPDDLSLWMTYKEHASVAVFLTMAKGADVSHGSSTSTSICLCL